MALSSSTLATLLKGKIEAGYANNDFSKQDGLQKFCDAIAEAVVEHIIAAAVVTSAPTAPWSTSDGATTTGSTTGTIS